MYSYYPKPKDELIVATRTEYGVELTSAVWHDNVFATQFHPEKSQKVGLQLLKQTFVNIIQRSLPEVARVATMRPQPFIDYGIRTT